MTEKGTYQKVFIDFPLLVLIGIPVFIMSYLWRIIQAAWWFGEFCFDPEIWNTLYGKKKP